MTVQLENGYTRIANEILEVIPTIGLNGTQHNILWIVFRYTYGFQRKQKVLSLSFIAKATNSHKVVIQREVKRLIDMNILIEVSGPTFNKGRTIAFNKDYESWELTNKLTLNRSETVNQNDELTVNQLVSETVNQLVNQERKKENIKEMAIDISSSPSVSTKKPYEDYFAKVWEAYHNKKGKSKVTAKQKLKLYNEVPEEQMLKAIEKYKKETKDTESRYIMHGSTWFNGGYEDYIDPVKAPSGPKKEPVYGSYEEKMNQMVEEGLKKMKSKPKIKIKPYEEKLKELEEAELRRLTYGYDQGT